MTIPEKITAYMQSAGIASLSEFARRADIPFGTLSNLFHAPDMNVTKGTLVKIKNLLRVPLDVLVDDDAEINFAQYTSEGGGTLPDNTVISIGRGGARKVYQLSDADAQFVDAFLSRMINK